MCIRDSLSNNMTGRQMIGVGVRRVVLARGELDKLEGPQYAARRAELRREAGDAARARDRQAAVALQNEAEESGATDCPLHVICQICFKNRPLAAFQVSRIFDRKQGCPRTRRSDSLPSVRLPSCSAGAYCCLLYTSPSPRDLSTSRMPSSA